MPAPSPAATPAPPANAPTAAPAASPLDAVVPPPEPVRLCHDGVPPVSPDAPAEPLGMVEAVDIVVAGWIEPWAWPSSWLELVRLDS